MSDVKNFFHLSTAEGAAFLSGVGKIRNFRSLDIMALSLDIIFGEN